MYGAAEDRPIGIAPRLSDPPWVRRAGSVADVLRRPVLALVVAGVTLAACGDDAPAGDAERFCGEIDVHRDALTRPQLTYEDDIEPVLDLYRMIGDLAPLAIEREWDQLITNFETASTVVPDDPTSVQRAVEMAYRSETSAAAVDRWLRENCGIDMGPVSTIVPQNG